MSVMQCLWYIWSNYQALTQYYKWHISVTTLEHQTRFLIHKRQKTLHILHSGVSISIILKTMTRNDQNIVGTSHKICTCFCCAYISPVAIWWLWLSYLYPSRILHWRWENIEYVYMQESRLQETIEYENTQHSHWGTIITWSKRYDITENKRSSIWQLFHTAMQWLKQNINEKLNPQKTTHSSPWWVGYGVSFVRILEKIDHTITAWHST